MGIQISALHVRRSSLIQATPESVWEEFTSFERLAAWFGQGHQLDVYEPELDGQVVLSVEIDGARRSYGGPILIFETPRELTFSNNWESDGWPVPTLITLRLTPLFDACLVELFHHGFERLGSNAGAELEGYEDGCTLTTWKPSRRSLKARRRRRSVPGVPAAASPGTRRSTPELPTGDRAA